jgi:DNA polymerase III subunit gamma/tau
VTDVRVPLAAKYRPQTFTDVAWQKPTRTVLYLTCKNGNVPPGMLFSGERGCGKTTMARMVAKALNCTGESRKASQWPCNGCASCRAVDNETHMDVEELDAASNGTVDQVREIRDRAYQGPLGGGYKVFIVDEAHGLSKSAWQAILKILEEPPAGVLFIFCTTESSKVPAPVHSRTSPFLFTPFPVAAVRGRLQYICEQEGFAAEPELLAALAESCRGGMRDAVVRLDQLASVGISSYAMWQQLTGETDFAPGLVTALAEGDMSVAYADMRAALSVYGSASRVSDDLVDCLADVLTLTCGGEILHQGRPLEDRQALAAKLGPQRAHAAMAVLWDLETRVRADSREKALTMALAVIARRLAPRAEAPVPIGQKQPASAASIREIMEHA